MKKIYHNCAKKSPPLGEFTVKTRVFFLNIEKSSRQACFEMTLNSRKSSKKICISLIFTCYCLFVEKKLLTIKYFLSSHLKP